MNKLIKYFIITTTAIACFAPQWVDAAACIGCVDLDELTFDKTIKRFPYTLVKFDVAFPFGEKHEAFSAFAKAAHSMTDDLLIAHVGIKDYGENENKLLGERFKIDDKNYPGIYLFKQDVNDFVQLPSYLDCTLDNLKTFVNFNTDLYIGNEGCLKDFNELAKNFANLSDEEQQERLQKAKELIAAVSREQDIPNAKTYVLFMEKIMAKGYQFVEEETNRLYRVRAGKVSDAKKLELSKKLNILESLRVNKLTKNDEL